jgi:hypothetical protein
MILYERRGVMEEKMNKCIRERKAHSSVGEINGGRERICVNRTNISVEVYMNS